ncbi:MAG: hypothetical protein ACTSWK_14090 [Promethearchaeota archaeon]
MSNNFDKEFKRSIVEKIQSELKKGNNKSNNAILKKNLEYIKKHNPKYIREMLEMLLVLDEHEIDIPKINTIKLDLALRLYVRINILKIIKEVLGLCLKMTNRKYPIGMFYCFVFFKYELVEYLLFLDKYYKQLIT